MAIPCRSTDKMTGEAGSEPIPHPGECQKVAAYAWTMLWYVCPCCERDRAWQCVVGLN